MNKQHYNAIYTHNNSNINVNGNKDDAHDNNING